MYAEDLSSNEINELPIYQFSGGIFVIDTQEKLNQFAPLLQGQEILGFDTETRPSFKKGKVNPVSLLQLTTPTQAFLIRINKIGLPDKIKAILADRNSRKIGLAIKDDIKVLREINEFTPKSFIDLQDYVDEYGIAAKSLKKITAIVLNKRISKSQQVTNWEREGLSEAQQIYAATDAWVCLQIYKNLK